MEKDFRTVVQSWLDGNFDEATKAQIRELQANDPVGLEDAFYRNLEFGTGGLRGIMGVGTNRMNKYTVGMATQGLANYMKENCEGPLSVCISYDSRNNSPEFAQIAANVLAANGIHVYIFDKLHPIALMSYSVRLKKATAGIMITASHNPKEYNGYKVFWSDGAQVKSPVDKEIVDEVAKITDPSMVKFEAAEGAAPIEVMGHEMDEAYLDSVMTLMLSPEAREAHKDIKIVYTPIHGSGVEIVPEFLQKLGFENIYHVPEQDVVDGNFPTVMSPNPEEPSALAMAVEVADREGADLVMATDPDADRFGIAVPDANGKYVLISGNQMGALLTDYIIVSRKELGKMPANPAIVRSIVTSPFADKICEANGVKLVECLTGFKWIANEMAKFENTNCNNYIFGFEESYGYNVETDVRDKDGVSAAAMCAEMTLYWRTQGKSLLQRLEELYTTYGYFQDSAISQNFPGASGGQTMKNIMTKLRTEGLKSLGGKTVLSIRDVGDSVVYNPAKPENKEKLDLPKSNVIQFFLDGGTVVSARPSGTEPKIKFYINCVIENSSDLAKAKEEADKLTAAIDNEIKEVLASVK